MLKQVRKTLVSDLESTDPFRKQITKHELRLLLNMARRKISTLRSILAISRCCQRSLDQSLTTVSTMIGPRCALFRDAFWCVLSRIPRYHLRRAGLALMDHHYPAPCKVLECLNSNLCFQTICAPNTGGNTPRWGKLHDKNRNLLCILFWEWRQKEKLPQTCAVFC